MSAFARSDLSDLNVFLTIVRRGSFRQAATELGVTTSALSHSVKKLEGRLEVRLLNRTSRSVVPTQAGSELARRLADGFQTIGDALSALDAYRHSPVGRLRINLLKDASRLLVAPVLADFLCRYPQVHLDLTVEDRPVDIIAEGFDAGIRYESFVPKDMIATALTPPLRWVVVGSPDYLARYGRPRHPEDLRHHSCVQMRLEIIMPEWASLGPPFAMYYSSRRQPPPGLRQLIGIVRERNGLAAPLQRGGAAAKRLGVDVLPRGHHRVDGAVPHEDPHPVPGVPPLQDQERAEPSRSPRSDVPRGQGRGSDGGARRPLRPLGSSHHAAAQQIAAQPAPRVQPAATSVGQWTPR
jgi:DNA-binding transcriptional LysR family regulator